MPDGAYGYTPQTNKARTGSWGTPELGITEAIGGLFGSGRTSEGGSDIIPNKPKAGTPVNTKPVNAPGGGGAGGAGAGNASANASLIDSAANAQQNAANAQSDALKGAAMAKYNVTKKAAEQAKGAAKGDYDWIIETIGTNKQDLLRKVTASADTQVQNYNEQQEKTTAQYEQAKGDILQTYRDLQRDQEKVLRGSGLGSSSRAMEAKLKLSGLLGKDMSKVSTNEADSIAMIGNAITAVKNKAEETRLDIEHEATQKQNEAGRDYQKQLSQIELNEYANEQQRAVDIQQAEAGLAAATANITNWASQAKANLGLQIAQLGTKLDDFVTNMASSNGLLNASIDEKQQATSGILSAAKNITLDQDSSAQTSKTAKYVSKAKKPEEQNGLFTGDNLLTAVSGNTDATALAGGNADPLMGAVTA